jgi:hypothetical protein
MSLMDEKDNALLERGAANDIVRLRWRLKIRENIVARLVAENERLRNDAATSCETVLTHEERCAIATAIVYLQEDDDYPGIAKDKATLRSLLERLR